MIASSDFLSLKEISEHLGQKIDLIQSQISRISTSKRPAQDDAQQDSDGEMRRA